MSRARTRPKGKPTPSRREREQSRKEAMSPGDDAKTRFAYALAKNRHDDTRSELRLRVTSWGKDNNRLPNPTFTHDELIRLRTGDKRGAK